jgi:hypothetical protein
VTIYFNFREKNWRGVCETFIILLLSLLGYVKSKIGSILWQFQCVVDFYTVNMWVRQLSRDDLFDPSSGFYKRSQIASFQLPKNFIAVFRSWSIEDSLYYSHFIRIGFFSDVCLNGLKSWSLSIYKHKIFSFFPIHSPHRPTFGHLFRIFDINIFILHACGRFLQRASLKKFRMWLNSVQIEGKFY